jgi:hypothetical protein
MQYGVCSINHVFLYNNEKCNEEFAPKKTSFYTTMKKCDEEFAPKITSFYTTMKKCDKIRSERVMKRKEEDKQRRHAMIKSE